MDHLKAEGGLFEEKEHGRQGKIMRPLRDIFHHAARVYLTFLYTDWHGKGKRTKLTLLQLQYASPALLILIAIYSTHIYDRLWPQSSLSST